MRAWVASRVPVTVFLRVGLLHGDSGVRRVDGAITVSRPTRRRLYRFRKIRRPQGRLRSALPTGTDAQGGAVGPASARAARRPAARPCGAGSRRRQHRAHERPHLVAQERVGADHQPQLVADLVPAAAVHRAHERLVLGVGRREGPEVVRADDGGRAGVERRRGRGGAASGRRGGPAAGRARAPSARGRRRRGRGRSAGRGSPAGASAAAEHRDVVRQRVGQRARRRGGRRAGADRAARDLRARRARRRRCGRRRAAPLQPG